MDDPMDEKKSELMLANEHAAVNLSSLVYDPGEDNLLVAALAAASATELLLAIKAQLEKHSRNNHLQVIDLAGVAETLLVRGAGSGYAVVKSPLRKVNAKGMAVVFLHWFGPGIPDMWKPFAIADTVFAIAFVWSWVSLGGLARQNGPMLTS